jgi:heptosyltransferase-1
VNKLLPLSLLQEKAAAEKARGRTIVLANGCFDLIHVGHVRYLRDARSRGDVLVVALNSDESVRKLKGPGRPILSQEERAEILSSFSFVDHLVLFDEPTVENILLALKPDVHAKGSDYTPETVPERETTKKIGARTAITGGPKVRNTSDILGRIAASGREEDYLIVRLSSLGDIIHALPAFAALRRNRPGARITWAVGRRGRALLDLVPGLDRVVVVGDRGWRNDLRPGRGRRLVALDFQGLIKSGLIARLSGARLRIGFARRNLREPLACVFYNERAGAFPESRHVIEKNLHLLSRLGISETRFDFPLVVPEAVRERVRDGLRKLGWDGKAGLILCNVGAAWASKRWPPERWAEVLRGLKAEGRFLLLLWGDEAERALAEEAARKTGVPSAPFFNLVEVLAAIEESRLVLSGDTFALQAACALGTPVVGIFGPTTPGRNGPFRPEDAAAFHEISCSHCYRRSCPGLECMLSVTAGEVVALAEKRLAEAAGA